MGYLASAAAICAILSSQTLPVTKIVPRDTKFAGTYRLKDLPAGYLAYTIKYDLASANGLSPFAYSGGMAGNSEGALIFDLLTVSYTAGETITNEGVEYLVAYVPNLFHVARGMGTGTPKIAEVPLDLTYIRKDKILSIGPRADLDAGALLTPKSPTDPVEVDPAQKRTSSNLKQVALSFLLYSGDYDDLFPATSSTTDAQEVTYPYLKNAEVWRTYNPAGGRVIFNNKIAGASTSAIPQPAETVMLYEEKVWADGRRAVAFTDGHVKFVPDSEFLALMGSPTPYRYKGKPIVITGPRMFPGLLKNSDDQTKEAPTSAPTIPDRTGGGL
jgi:hypothetical protein